MKDVFALKKVSPALQRSLQLTRLALSLAVPALSDEAFRDFLLDHPQEILVQLRAIDVSAVRDAAYEQICRITEDAEYDPGVAARESEAGFFLDVDTILTALRRDLQAAHESSQRLLPTTTYCVGVDGSRQSFIAFEVVTRLRRQGTLTVVHVDEADGPHSIQMPVISSEFVVEDYKAHAERLRLPRHRVLIETVKQASASSSVATELLDTSARRGTDFLVLGSVGKGGPAIDQLGHVPRDVLRFTPLPVLIVPPAPVLAVPARSHVFVVAVDHASVESDGDDSNERSQATTMRSLTAVLKLMRSSDSLRIVHFYKPPVVGDFDARRFDFCERFLATAQVDGVVDVVALDTGYTIAESLHEYTAKHRASFLVLGLSGSGTAGQNRLQSSNADGNQRKQQQQHEDELAGLENAIGRVTRAMLFSPRCALCLCP